MSDHDEPVFDAGFTPPVPELDDHRYRRHRGTLDSLYAQQRDREPFPAADSSQPAVRIRDFEEAVEDEDASEISPLTRRSRRPTAVTMDRRSVSPPNSVKAFAEARRRERALSTSDPKAEKPGDEPDLHRAMSVASRHSHRSRPRTVEDDRVSLETNKSAEEDVCYPLQDEPVDDRLHIDFDYLETLIKAEEGEKQEELSRRPSGGRVFGDLRPDLAMPESAFVDMVTADGDFIKIPSASRHDEREAAEPEPAKAAPPADLNRFSFFSSAWESTVHAKDLSDLVLPGEDIRALFSFPRGEQDGVWWLNVSKPTEEEVRALCRAFGIHPLTIEDITTQESREKIELFPSYYFACFRSCKPVPEAEGEVEYEPFNIYVIVFREGTLSFSFEPNTHASDVRRRISLLKDYLSLSSDWICYALIDNIVDSFIPAVNKTENDTERIEDEVFIARPDDMHHFLRKIGYTRKNVMSLMRLLGGKADVLRGFTKRCNENYKVTPRMDIGLYLGDIQDHVVTMMTNLTNYEKMLSRAHSNYLAQLSIDSITQGTSTNRTLSKITIIASIIVPLNVITGLFGMNVKVPWFNGDPGADNTNAFWGIVGVLVGFSVVCIGIAKRCHYI